MDRGLLMHNKDRRLRANLTLIFAYFAAREIVFGYQAPWAALWF